MPKNPNPSDSQTGSGRPRGIQSVELGYRILIAIQQGPVSLPLKTIAARARMSPSAVHNYLTSLIRTGMVCADSRGHYRLGPSLAALGLSAARQVDKFELLREKAIALSEHTGLGVAVLTWNPQQGPIIIFNKSDPKSYMFELRNGPVGVLSTGGGRIFATYLPREVTLPVVLHETGRTKAQTRECQKVLEEVAHAVRQVGYASAMLDALPGYGAISVPVWDALDSVAYALSITAPAELINPDPGGPHITALVEYGREVSRLLGAPPERWAVDK
jgi:DNA-binding IclR family transcriptional regulator